MKLRFPLALCLAGLGATACTSTRLATPAASATQPTATTSAAAPGSTALSRAPAPTAAAPLPSATSTAATSIPSPSTTTATVGAAPTLETIDQANAVLLAAGIPCTLKPDTSGGIPIAIPPEPVVTLRSLCVISGSTFGFTTYQDEANRDLAHEQITTRYAPLLKPYGILQYVWIQSPHGAWTAGISNASGPPEAKPTQAELDLAAKIAAAFGGTVEIINL
jgi:hypothetical protein